MMFNEDRSQLESTAIVALPLTEKPDGRTNSQIERLSAKAQKTLSFAACLGKQFDEQTLAVACELSSIAVNDDLREALELGLIVRVRKTEGEDMVEPIESAGDFSFLSDRVRQAAYGLIPERLQTLCHLEIGQRLLEREGLEPAEKILFILVSQLNLGAEFITEQSRRMELAWLNLSAGRKLRALSAFDQALWYFKTGLSYFQEAEWESDYALAYWLAVEAAECQALTADFENAETAFAAVLDRSRTNLDKARVFNLRAAYNDRRLRYAEALENAVKGLSLFGVWFSESEPGQQAAFEREIRTVNDRLTGRRIDALIHLPDLNDPEIKMVMSLLTTAWSPATLSGKPTLARIIAAMIVRLSMVYGNSGESAFGYVTHAMTVCEALQDFEGAYEFGALALRVNEKYNDVGRRATIDLHFQWLEARRALISEEANSAAQRRTTESAADERSPRNLGEPYFENLVQAVQTISGELEREKLFTTVLDVVLKNAGAERVVLLLEHPDGLLIYAEGAVDCKEVKLRNGVPLDEHARLPVRLIDNVRTSLEGIVLHAPYSHEIIGQDAYLRSFQPSSVMVLPLLKQEKLIGVLYLENFRKTGAFPQDRVMAGRLLASQAALSIENARLYHEMKIKALHREQATPKFQTADQPISSVDLLQREHILNVLYQTNWVIGGKKGAAKALDLHPNTLRNRMKKLGIRRSNRKGS